MSAKIKLKVLVPPLAPGTPARSAAGPSLSICTLLARTAARAKLGGSSC